MKQQVNLNDLVPEDVNFGQIFRLLLMQSKLIFAVILIFSTIGIINYVNTTKVYKITSLIQVFSPQQMNPNSAIDLYLGDSDVSDISNIQNLYLSRTNILKIIEEMKLNILTDDLTFSEKIQLINSLSLENTVEKEININLYDDFYSVEFENGRKLDNLKYNKLVDSDGIKINLNKTTLANSNVTLSYTDPQNRFKSTRSKFEINPLRAATLRSQNSGLIYISYKSSDIDEALSVLDFSNSFFIQSNIKTESEQARKAVNFIDLKINEVTDQLEIDKSKLKEFQKENISINVDREIDEIIKALAEIDSNLNTIEIELITAANDYTESNPLFVNLQNRKSILESQKKSIEERIRQLPVAQRNYIDLFSALKTTEEIYSALLDRRLEFSIKEASTLGNIRVVDQSYYDSRVSPNLSSLIIFFGLGVIFAFIFALVRGVYFLPISNPAELEDNGIHTPIIGVLPKVEEDDEERESRFANSLESAIVNMQTLFNRNGECQTISLTSPTPENGKSFVSREIAMYLSKLNFKTCLVDFDFKRGDQHKAFNVEKMMKRDFLGLNDETIENYQINKNFYLLPKLSRIESSFQFLHTADFKEKLEFLRTKFDYIIFDTAPLLSVSDTTMILTLSDFNIFVARHGKNKINELKQLNALIQQVGQEFDGIIYNYYQKPNSYYGYYGLYGNYNYQYYAQKYLYEAYDYDKES